ncbi:MAG: hypothetical protein ACE5F5_09490 [Acidimicrobiia bacterium]
MIEFELPLFLALAVISFVVTLMLFPFVEGRHYAAARPPLFVGGVLFMPLFLAIAVVLRTDWEPSTRAWALGVLMAAFWASAVWLASERTQGQFVSGLEFGPGLNFRPDLILPGGVNLVKGLILTGIGIMLSVQESFRLPAWNWWGFFLALFGILTLIPVRGMVKMLARRSRFLGRGARWQVPARWGLLVFGLVVLLYGFLAAFMGRVPFVEFRPVAGEAGLAAALFAVSVLALLGREFWKTRLPEGMESTAIRFLSNLWLYGAILVFMYAAVLTFMGRIMQPHPAENPAGLVLGGVLFALGAVLVLGARPRALRNELLGSIRIMVGTLTTMPDQERWRFMLERMRTIASYPLDQRTWHVAQMMSAVATLDPNARPVVEKTRAEVMMSLSSEERRRIMECMDRLVA